MTNSPSARRRTWSGRAPRHLRRGAVLVEGLVVIVVMTFLTVALVQWSLLMVAHQAAQSAVVTGARLAARTAPADRLQAATDATAVVLAAHGIPSDGGSVSPALSTVTVDARSYVQLELDIPVEQCVPDWLAVLHFSLAGHSIHVAALAPLEN